MVHFLGRLFLLKRRIGLLQAVAGRLRIGARGLLRQRILRKLLDSARAPSAARCDGGPTRKLRPERPEPQ